VRESRAGDVSLELHARSRWRQFLSGGESKVAPECVDDYLPLLSDVLSPRILGGDFVAELVPGESWGGKK
jgi:hypothetical protein